MAGGVRLRAINPPVCNRSARRFAQDDGFVVEVENIWLGCAFRGKGKPSKLATDGLQGFIEFEGKRKAFAGHWAMKMDYGLRAAGGEGLSDEVAGASVEGTVEAVGGLGGAELAGGAGGDGVLDGEWGAGGVGDGSGAGGEDGAVGVDGADEVDLEGVDGGELAGLERQGLDGVVDQLAVVEVVVDPLVAGADVELVQVSVAGADEVDVLLAVGLSVGVERAAGGGDRAVAGEQVEIVVDPLGVGVDVKLADVAVGPNEVDVLGVVVAPVAGERAVGRGPDAVAGELVEVVVDPVGVESDVELVDLSVSPDEVDVLAAVGAEIATEGAGAGRADAVAGQVDEVVVDPVAMGCDVELADVAVGAYEIDVLAVVGVEVAVERAVGAGTDAVAGLMDEVVIDPVAVRGEEELVDVVVGTDEVDVLAAVLVDVAVERGVGQGQD